MEQNHSTEESQTMEELRRKITDMKDMDTLTSWLIIAARADSLGQFREKAGI